MKTFLKNTLDAFLSLFRKGGCNSHQMCLFFAPLIVAVMFSSLIGALGSVMLLWLLGVIMELTYWFVPYKEYTVFGFKVMLPDYSRLNQLSEDRQWSLEHAIDFNDCYYQYASTIVFVILSVLGAIFV